MKRIVGLVLVSLLTLPACTKSKDENVDMEAEIAKNLKKADADLRNNKVDEAKKGYQWVLEQDPDNVAALTGLGRVELDGKNYAGAIPHLEKAVAAGAEDARARATLGRAHVGAKDWAKAAEHLGKAWELSGKEKEQYAMEWGVALRESGKLEEAAAALEAAAELNPKLKYVYRELGKVHQKAGELDKALTTFMKAQIEWEGDQESYAGAAQIYEAKGEISKAVDQWSFYIQQDCCSTYSKEVAQPKLAELKEQENTAGPTVDPAEDAAG